MPGLIYQVSLTAKDVLLYDIGASKEKRATRASVISEHCKLDRHFFGESFYPGLYPSPGKKIGTVALGGKLRPQLLDPGVVVKPVEKFQLQWLCHSTQRCEQRRQLDRTGGIGRLLAAQVERTCLEG